MAQDVFIAKPRPSEWNQAGVKPQSDKLAVLEDATRTKRVAQQALNVLLSDPALRNINLGELMARRHAHEALAIMMDIARDPEVDPKTRHQSAYDVWTIAYGRPAAVVRGPGDASMPPTIDADIERAQEAADALAHVEEWGALPPEYWPLEVQKATGQPAQSSVGKMESSEGESDGNSKGAV